MAGAAAMALVAWLAWPRAQAPVPATPPVATTPAPTPAVVDAPEVPVIDDEIIEAPDADAPVDEETAWAALDDEDAEVYAWLADAPVAPDDEGDAL